MGSSVAQEGDELVVRHQGVDVLRGVFRAK
jgi:hypothetical protein